MAVRTEGRASSRKRRRSNVFGYALVGIAVIVAAVIFRKHEVVQAPPQTAIVAEFDTVQVPVPAEQVPIGTRVKDIRFRTVAYPKHQLPKGTLQSLDSIAEAVTVAPLPANLPLFAANFSLTAHTTNPVLERIPPGMRAMTIRVDATSAVEGWAGSGSIVDVLLVEKSRTAVVAEKVRVLSAERSVSPVEGSSSPNIPSTVTLLVSQEQCLAINTAIPLGKIAFALRSNRDDADWADTLFTPDNLKGGATVPRPKQSITGYASLKGANNNDAQAFALADGKWTRTQSVPEGFLVASGGG